MPYSESDRAQLLRRLAEAGEADYKRFNESLLPGVCDTLGVRIPVLRRFAREQLAGDWRAFLEREPEGYDERMLYALVLAGARCPLAEKLGRAAAFLPKIDNWSLCDTFCSAFHDAARDLDAVAAFLGPYYASPAEFDERFAAVMRLRYFLTPETGEESVRIFCALPHPGYYVRMAAAWGLATAYGKFPQEVRAALAGGALDDFTHNKTIQKLRESRLVPAEEKASLQKMRR